VFSTFRTSGKTVRVDEFRPSGSAPAALVILLHGSAGPDSRNFPYAMLAAALVNRDWTVQMPHYFDAAKRNMGGRGEPSGIWITSVRDEIDAYWKRSGTDCKSPPWWSAPAVFRTLTSQASVAFHRC
jgi:dienelactone hydrolase